MTLRIGVVGAGGRATLACHVFDHDATIVAAADPHPDAATRVARLGEGIEVVKDHHHLIDFGIDAAFVTSPDDTHAAITIDLLRAHVPVFLEKPLAITIPDADEVLSTAYETRTRLYVGHNMRHMHVVQIMRELISEGAVGEVKAIWCRHFVGHGGDFYFKDWHAEREHGTGLLLQKGSHDIDVIHWLADSVTREVAAIGDLMVYGSNPHRGDNSSLLAGDWLDTAVYPPEELRNLNPVIDVEDVSMMLMRLDSGVLASYQQCHFTPDYWRNYTVIGTKGRLENFGDGEGGIVKLWNRRSGYRAEADAEYPIIGDDNGHRDADALTVAEFLRFIREGGPTETNPLSARDAVAAGIAATDSLRNGSQPRRVPAVADKIASYFLAHQPQKTELSV